MFHIRKIGGSEKNAPPLRPAPSATCHRSALVTGGDDVDDRRKLQRKSQGETGEREKNRNHASHQAQESSERARKHLSRVSA